LKVSPLGEKQCFFSCGPCFDKKCKPSNVLIIVQPQWIHQMYVETELAPTAQVSIPHQSGDMNFWKSEEKIRMCCESHILQKGTNF
jgi:hypothetical protein